VADSWTGDVRLRLLLSVEDTLVEKHIWYSAGDYTWIVLSITGLERFSLMAVPLETIWSRR